MLLQDSPGILQSSKTGLKLSWAAADHAGQTFYYTLVRWNKSVETDSWQDFSRDQFSGEAPAKQWHVTEGDYFALNTSWLMVSY